MVGFFGTCAASGHPNLQLRAGSGHEELTRPNKYRPRSTVRCCSSAKGRTKDYYFQVLGVTVHSTPQEIKEAYRKLQKQHHPDIAGYQGMRMEKLRQQRRPRRGAVQGKNSGGNPCSMFGMGC